MKPMLAAPADAERLSFPLLASPKLDGVRCIVVDGKAVARSLKPIPNDYVRAVLSSPALNGLDGELVVGPATAPDVYRRTVSAVMSKQGKPGFRFVVFDSFLLPGPFEQRLAQLAESTALARLAPHGHLLRHEGVTTAAELRRLEARYIKEGYEGVMLRSLLGPYKHGRSTAKEGYLLKLKRFADGEARVVGWAEQQHNTNPAKRDELGRLKRSSHAAGKVRTEKLGALMVEDVVTKARFDIGTGFLDAERRRLWAVRATLIGRLVKYRHQPAGAHEAPRFPVFVGWRDEVDT